jgi:hypothetical protein
MGKKKKEKKNWVLGLVFTVVTLLMFEPLGNAKRNRCATSGTCLVLTCSSTRSARNEELVFGCPEGVCVIAKTGLKALPR